MIMNHTIFLFGASCSGKSTVGKALQHRLGNDWTYIDRDELIESELATDSTANALLDEKIQRIGKHSIIDAQIPWREKKAGELYFLILPPLSILLERDAVRNLRLKRSIIRAYYAKQYVIETYQKLATMEKKEFTYSFKSSEISVQDQVNLIKTFLNCRDSSQSSHLHNKYKWLVVAMLACSLVYILFLSIEEKNLKF